MGDINRKKTSFQYSFLVGLFFTFVFIIAILIEFVFNKQIPNNFEGIKLLIKNSGFFWTFLLLIPLSSIIAYYISKILLETYDKISEELIEDDKKIKEFIKITQQLINGNYDVEIKTDKENILLELLKTLGDTLKQNKELQEKRQKEDEIRNWKAEGLARFGAILRYNADNIKELAFQATKELVKYINAIQGSFFLLNDDDPNNLYFEQLALYAYDRRKFADKKIKWGDGLIGTCALEKRTIYMTKIPHSYVFVTSGLGYANPSCLLLVPMISNNELYGVLEIASLQPLKPHEIEFAEQAAESIAATLFSVKITLKTAKLLEETKEQAQTLAAQEEEMRQNMEELQATQEELSRQAQKFIRLENTVNHTMIRAEYNIDGILLYANTKFLKKLEYSSNSEVEGKHITTFISDKDKDWFLPIWENLTKGGRHFEGYMKHITKTGKDLWTMSTYTCVRDENGNVEKILFLAIDTTDQKKLSLRMEGIVDAINRAGIKIELSCNGNILEYNDIAKYVFEFTDKEFKELTIFDIIDPLDVEIFSNKWDSVVKGFGFHGQFRMRTKNGDTKWLRGAFSAVYDMYGDVSTVMFIGHDTTNEKLMEIELRNQTELLKKQEKLLKESEKELSRKLRETRLEVQNQYREIEKIKLRHERTLEGALDAILTISHDNRIIFFNKAAEDMFGYKKEEILGKDVSILFSPKTIEEDEFVAKFTGPGDDKIIGLRKEVTIKTKDNKNKQVLILLSKARVDDEITYTAFIQNIELELF